MGKSASRNAKRSGAGTKARLGLAQLGFLATSRRRQRDVFGPAIIAIVVGGVLILDAMAGPELPAVVQILLMLLFGAWAGTTARRWFEAEGHRTVATNVLIACGAVLVAGAVARLLGINVALPWAVLLVLFALATLIRE
jgi:hypothetical protein